MLSQHVINVDRFIVKRDIKLLNCMKIVGWSVKIITCIDLISVQE